LKIGTSLNTKLENELATKNLVNSRQTAFYDSDRQSTLYYLKPSTSSIYLFNLEKNEFVAESLKYTGPP